MAPIHLQPIRPCRLGDEVSDLLSGRLAIFGDRKKTCPNPSFTIYSAGKILSENHRESFCGAPLPATTLYTRNERTENTGLKNEYKVRGCCRGVVWAKTIMMMAGL